MAVDPPLKSISEDERHNYIKDYEKEIINHPGVVFENMAEGGKVDLLYEMLTVCALKPSETVEECNIGYKN